MGAGSATEQPRQGAGRRRRSLILGLLVALGLVVGLGVGLGTRRSSPSSASTASGTTPASGTTHPNGSDPTIAPSTLIAQDGSTFVLRGRDMLRDRTETRTFQFVLEERRGAPDGFSKPMLVVNGMYPGPTIEVNEGDRVVVNVTNLMNTSTAIHWHGLYQRGTNFYDGTSAITQCGIPPGQSMVYNFTLDGWSGTTCAHHGTQYTDGLTGAFIVHAANDHIPTYGPEIVLQLSDLYHGFSTDLLARYLSPDGITGAGNTGVTQGNEPVPDAGTINGVGQWNGSTTYSNYSLLPETTYRLRLINSGSFAAMRFSIDGHPLTVVEADGTSVVPYQVGAVVIDVAQRYSVLFTTGASGAYWIRATVQQDSFTYSESGFDGNTLAVLRYGVGNETMPNSTLSTMDPGSGVAGLLDMAASSLVPVEIVAALKSTLSYTLTISMQNTNGGHWLSFVNSTSWSPLVGTSSLFSGIANTSTGATVTDSQLIITVPQIEVVDIIVDNLDDGDHPVHLHGYKMMIMGTGLGRYQGQALNATNPMRRDTVLLSAYTWTVLRFVADNPGYWAFHCHLSWHMAAGLLMQFSTLPSQSALLPVPQYMRDQCSYKGL